MPMNRVQFQKGLSMPEFLDRYGTEERCEQALVAARWPSGFVCSAPGGSNLATALSLNACPYRAKSVLHRRPLGLFYGGDNYSDAGGWASPRLRG